jgi:hypothetical protein
MTPSHAMPPLTWTMLSTAATATNVFFSYPHDVNVPLVERIKADLEARGSRSDQVAAIRRVAAPSTTPETTRLATQNPRKR